MLVEHKDYSTELPAFVQGHLNKLLSFSMPQFPHLLDTRNY